MSEKTDVLLFADSPQELLDRVPEEVFAMAQDNNLKAIPEIAKNPDMVQTIEETIRNLETNHQLVLGDSRYMEKIADESVHLVITSPPYWTLKEYPARDGQLGLVEDYEVFLEELDKVWQHVFRVLAPGGRLVVVVGDVCLPRR